jgi:hypothetical protein
MELISQIFSAIGSVLQQNGIGPPSPPSAADGASSLSSSSASGTDGGQGSSSMSELLSQNGVSPEEFRQNLLASVQQGGGSSLDLSQLFQNFSSGQSVNLSA